ncbi:MAG: tyrosine--tRNA ligase [Patescibacteria group bacterium]
MDKQLEEVLTRGVENIYPSRDFLEKLLKSNKKLTIYTGYDPTAPTLHIGHGITMLKLRQFQDLGHKIIFLIGDFTGMIGDPTDKASARQQLTREQVLKNCKEYKKQASAILRFSGKNPVEIKYNSKWFSKMNFGDVLELSSKFTVQRMLERDMFQVRMGEGRPIYVHEFMYPIMQAYDSVIMDVDGEVGGNDQTFNMLAGRDLVKAMKNKEKFVLTMKLLTDASGKKMGKSEGNMIALADSAEEMFGKVMSWSDEMIVRGFELCTKLAADEIKKMENELAKGANPRDLKLKLAFEIVKTFLGEKEAGKAEDNFIKTFSKKEVPEEIKEVKIKSKNILDVLVESGLCSSKGDARRNVEQGGVSIDGETVKDFNFEIKSGAVIKKGKRHFVKIK